MDKHHKINSDKGIFNDKNEELLKIFKQRFNVQPKAVDKICWFHLTRTIHEEKFNEGLLPLSKSLDKVWNLIFNIFKDTEHYNNLKKMKASGIPDYHYTSKINDNLHSGPYAMLVKDIAFYSQSVQNHDYLRIPEIIEDICNGYKESFGVPIIDILESALTPKIIKFISNQRIDTHCVESAFSYAYKTYNHQSLSIHTNTCFNGKNITIPYENILKVEILKK